MIVNHRAPRRTVLITTLVLSVVFDLIIGFTLHYGQVNSNTAVAYTVLQAAGMYGGCGSMASLKLYA